MKTASKLQFVNYLLTLILLFAINSCYDELKSKGGFPKSATNLSIFNSAYDDYNSAMTGDGEIGQLVFSSNRNSKGADFDLIRYDIFIGYDFASENVTFSNRNGGESIFSTTTSMLETINSNKDELGPFIFKPKD